VRPNLKDVMALLDSVSEGETFSVVIDQKQWSCWSGGPYIMGRDRRKSVRKAIDDAEKNFNKTRAELASVQSTGDDKDNE
jgi:predicted oxidoreductase